MKGSVAGKLVFILLLFSYLAHSVDGVPLSTSSWLKRWRDSGRETHSKDQPHYDGSGGLELDDEDLDDDYSHIPLQLKAVVCPSQPGRELKDYWRCLWRSSLTAHGIDQGVRRQIEVIYEEAAHRHVPGYLLRNMKAEMNENSKAAALMEQPDERSVAVATEAIPDDQDDDGEVEVTVEDETVGRKDDSPTWEPPHLKRVKRQQPVSPQPPQANPFKDLIDQGFADVAKVIAKTEDLKLLLDSQTGVAAESILKCQRDKTKPGESLKDFINCLIDYSPEPLSKVEELKNPTFPDEDVPYDQREFPLQTMDLNADLEDEPGYVKEDFELRFAYERINKGSNEDRVTDFSGADPYLGEQNGDYRYTHDNLVNQQDTPSWSYVGKRGAATWHELTVQRFFIPLDRDTDLKKIALVADIAQTYPGLGELANKLEIENPMDFGWTKDSGFFAHNRYLLPLLTENDLKYYKYKGMLEDSVTVRPDKEILQDIITALKSFQEQTKTKIDSSISNINDIKFKDTYKSFVSHYYGVHVTSFLSQLAESRNETKEADELTELTETYDMIRRTCRLYVEAVLAQEECMKVMVDKYSYRREAEDLEELIKMTMAANETCPNEELITTSTTENPAGGAVTKRPFKVPHDELKKLYKSYFDRKEARQAYSLPVYPNQFPICYHTEPSPIDIITKNSRKSSLRDYELGEAGYRLNRFFMSIPYDGTPLLSLGILAGERLDDSSVRLSGGAVKGQNLTFQYMFFRFASVWTGNGSEHTFDGKGAPMEIQMIFTLAGSTDEIKYWHILARVQNQLFQFRGKLIIILSVLVDVLESDKQVIDKIRTEGTKQDPYLFDPLAQVAYRLRKDFENHPTEDVPRGYVSREPTFRLADFLPKVKSIYYTYRGSLTWPPCFGYVVWSVFEKRLYISKRQFDQFARIPAQGISDTNLMADNTRTQKDIKVKVEEGISWSQAAALLRRRTTDRFVLEGIHTPSSDDEQLTAGIVDEEGYYNDDDLIGSGDRNRPLLGRVTGTILTALLPLLMFLLN